MTALLNYFYRVDITVLMYLSGTTTTKTYSFVNKALKDSTSIATYWPILKSIGEYSVSEGETLPNISLSAIEIDNTIGSFGPNRKFSDVLQRYSPIEQTVVLYLGQVSNTSDTVSSWTTIGQGLISDWEASSADGEGSVTFNLRAQRYSETILNLEVARTVSGMENAPVSSLGRTVPLLFSSGVDCVPVRISADGASTTTKWAIGTCLYQFLENKTSSAIVYAKNPNDTWERIYNGTIDYSGGTSLGTRTLNTYSASSYGTNLNNSAFIGGVKLACKGNGVALRVSTARLTVFLLQENNNGSIEQIAQGEVFLSLYDTDNNAGTARFYINVSFDKPVFLSALYNYTIGYSVTGYQVNELSLHYCGSFVRGSYRKDPASSAAYDSPDQWRRVFGSPDHYPLCYKLNEITFSFTDHVSTFTQTGLTYTSMTATQTTADSGQTNPSLDNYPLLVGSLSGLTVYGGGATIDRPQSIAEVLAYTWNGSSWVANNSWDTSTLLASHYEYLYNGATPSLRSRVVRGAIEAKVTYSQLLSEICRCTASKVGVLPTGKSFMYPFGMTVTPARDIPYSDITSLSWAQRDISTVVNRAVIKVGRSNLLAARDFETDENTGYQYVTDFAAANYPQVAAMTAESRALFGQKDLDSGEFSLWPYPSGGSGAYLGDSSSEGSILAEYYLGRFGKPIVECSFIVPYARYSDLRMFNVITFTHVEFPAFYGTDPNARDGTVDVGGAVSTVSTADSGYETVRAQTYRGLITGHSLVLAMEHAPVYRLTVQVLLNGPFDPT